MNKEISVPRDWERFGRNEPVEDIKAVWEWNKTRKGFLKDREKYEFGTKESKKAWLKRISKTRSL